MRRWLGLALALGCAAAALATQPPQGYSPGTVAQPPSIHQVELEEHNRLPAVAPPPYPLHYAVRPGWIEAEPELRALSRTIYGFLPYWVYTDLTHIRWDLLTHIAFFCLEMDASGAITNPHNWPNGTYVAALRSAAAANGVPLTITATLFNSTSIATLLGSSANRQNAINNLISQAQAGGAKGVCIDFEGVPVAQKANLVTFMADLTDAFHAAIPGSHVALCTPAVDWSGAFDYDQLAIHSDGMFIMAYDYYWSGSSTAGPVSPTVGSALWGTRAVDWTINDYLTYGGSENRSKFIVGLPYYGYQWPTVSTAVPSSTTGTGTSKTYNVAKANAAAYGRRWDTSGKVPYYVISAGPYQCFYDDEESLGLKWDQVNAHDLGGTGMWALNYDTSDDALWNTLEAKFAATPSGEMAGIAIGIDPGHGGDDPGAVGPTGLSEKDINLTGALMLKDALEARGASVYMTRTADATVSLSARYNYFNSIPVDRAESYHHNASVNPTANYTGVHVYWTEASGCNAASANSRDMAAKTALRLDAALNIGVVSSNCSPSIYGVHGDNFAMVHYTAMPAMLTEGSFISNPAEEALLYTAARNCTIAGAVAKGIEDHYGVPAEAPPCAAGAAGTCGNPIPIAAFPYTDTNDTTGQGAALNGYSCPPSSGSEAGPELVYKVTIPAAGTLTVTVTDGTGVDIDPHLLSTCHPSACLARHDTTFSVFLQPGDYFLVCDTWTSSTGTQYPGAYTLTVAFAADTTPPVVTITSPTSSSTYSTGAATISLGGTASDNTGVTRVTWGNDRGGGGMADGTTTWTVSSAGLYSGANVFTVTAYDGANNTSTDVLTVTCTDATAPAPIDSLKWRNGRWEWDAVTRDKNGNPETMGHYEIWRATSLRNWDFTLYADDIETNHQDDPASPAPGAPWFYVACPVDAVGNSEPPISITLLYGDAVYTGSWIQGGSADCRGGSGQYKYATAASVTATAAWSFTPTVSGEYHVAVRFVAGPSNRTVVRYTVNHRHGSTPVMVDQTVDNCSWVPLGAFAFEAGQTYTVVLDNQAAVTGKVAIAEAVKWFR